MKRVTKGQFHFDSPWWDHISDNAKDVVRNLLTVDPAKRFTVEDFLAHPWVREGSQEPLETIPEAPHDTSQPEVPKSNPPATADSGANENEPLPSPASLAIRGQAECRTPDFMNVAEIFDVAFSVHQIEDERRRQERILGKLSSTNNATSQMSQMSLSGPKAVNRLPFMTEPPSPDHAASKINQSHLNMDQSALLEKRRTRQQCT
jgi:serine/threonine protein kinase